MESQTQTLLNAVLALPAAEQAAFVERLLESLTPDGAEVSEEEWRAELDRRHDEALRGEAGGIPWSKLKDQT